MPSAPRPRGGTWWCCLARSGICLPDRDRHRPPLAIGVPRLSRRRTRAGCFIWCGRSSSVLLTSLRGVLMKLGIEPRRPARRGAVIGGPVVFGAVRQFRRACDARGGGDAARDFFAGRPGACFEFEVPSATEPRVSSRSGPRRARGGVLARNRVDRAGAEDEEDRVDVEEDQRDPRPRRGCRRRCCSW